jgi:uncharacterized surface protein with fasciclin (FAS1) repeats
MMSNRIRARMAIVAGLVSLIAVSCSGSDAAAPTTAAPAATTTTAAATPTSSLPAPTKSILQLAKEEGELTTFLGLLDTAGLTETIEGDGPFTLVTPTDAAFKKMDPDTLDKISKNPEVLKSLLLYHLINGRVTSKDLSAGFVTSVEGTTIALQPTDQLPTVNGLIVTRAGRATNGTILVVESVLLPVDLKLP